MKICTKCKKKKLDKEFHVNKTQKRGRCYICNDCKKDNYDKNQEKITAHRRTFYSKNKDRIMIKQRKRLYGISDIEYKKLFLKQKGICAICKGGETTTSNGKIKKLSIDHNHETGQIRGLLCQRCNTAIGMLSDNTECLARAIVYIEKYKVICKTEISKVS